MVPAYAVEGHPAFIVHAAGRGWLDPEPDVVLSGINLGSNVGHAVLHSGTVGAALTASLHGWRGLAVSLDTGWRPPEHPHWDSVLHVLPEVLDILLGGRDGLVLSLNVPDRPVDELLELREARLAAFGEVQVRVNHRRGEDGEVFVGVGQCMLQPVGHRHDQPERAVEPVQGGVVQRDRVPVQHHPVDADRAAGLGLAGQREQPGEVEVGVLADR